MAARKSKEETTQASAEATQPEDKAKVSDDTQPVFKTAKTVNDPELIKFGDDNTFSVKSGGLYDVVISLTLQTDASIRIFDVDNDVTLISNNRPLFQSTFIIEDNINLRIDYRPSAGYQWHPIQTLSPDQYSVTLTLK